MSTTKGRPKGGQEFPKVREAREALRQKAVGIWERYEAMIVQAVAAGEFDVANSAYQFLITHMPADEDGTRMVDVSIDKQEKKDNRRQMPSVNIGFKLGGVDQKALPEVTVVEAETDE